MATSSQGTIIHPSAVLHSRAKIGTHVTISPFCVIGENVAIGDHTILHPGVILDGWTTIGSECELFSHCVIGGPPQDIKYEEKISYIQIGNKNILREFTTINRPTNEGGVTSIGDENFLMAYSHIAHNCTVGNHVVMANAATLAGHVVIEDHVVLGGLTGIHQFVRIGAFAMVGGCSKVVQDIPPYIKVDGHPVVPHGLNGIGLRRNGFDSQTILQLKHAYRILYREGIPLEESLQKIQDECGDSPAIYHFLDFIRQSQSNPQRRGICR